MKKFFTALVLLLTCSFSFAQRMSAADRRSMEQKEDSMKLYAEKIISGINPDDRLKADSTFTRILMRALKTKNSFYYQFDSLETISQLYAPDSSFKIFTWQLVINDDVIRQHGAIQMRTGDGSLKRYPLIDKSDVTVNIKDTIGNNAGWIGAVYYKIIQKKYNNKDYYTLLGFDEDNIKCNRKIAEVLTFVNDEPIFGGRYFDFENDAISSKKINSRFVMEFKKDAGPRLTYDKDMDLIIVEHLISESNEPAKRWTLVGDGDYEGFKWINGMWVHIEKIYTYITPEGQVPVPNPIRDNGGNLLDNKLENDQNTTEEKPKEAVKPKTKKKG
jgi:hypothetical protein